MYIRALNCFFLIFLAFTGLVRGQVANAASNSNCSPSTPVSEIACSTIPGIKIETIYPAHMIVNQSYVIAVLLVSQTGAPPDFKALENATMVVTHPTPVGTPGATVGQAFGAGLEPFANATLNSGSFKVLSASSNEQSLRVPTVEWDWNVTPQSTGTQILSVDISIKWKSTQSGFVPFVPQFGIGNPQVSVTVTDAPAHPVAPPPFFTLGQINLGNLIMEIAIGILLFSTLAVLFFWLLKLIEERAKRGF